MEYLVAAAAMVYFILGCGVWSLWKETFDCGNPVEIIIAWPIVLFVAALVNRK